MIAQGISKIRTIVVSRETAPARAAGIVAPEMTA